MAGNSLQDLIPSMTLIIDNKKWPRKRIYKELRTDSKIESYRNKKDGNIPCWFRASPIPYGALNNFWRWHERDSTAKLWHSERDSTAPLITYQYHIVNRWCHHLNPASVSHLNSLIIEGMKPVLACNWFSAGWILDSLPFCYHKRSHPL
jgi:hypothetical protein